jgi:hypothetical protein
MMTRNFTSGCHALAFLVVIPSTASNLLSPVLRFCHHKFLGRPYSMNRLHIHHLILAGTKNATIGAGFSVGQDLEFYFEDARLRKFTDHSGRSVNADACGLTQLARIKRKG